MLMSKAPDRPVRGRLAGNTPSIAEPAAPTPQSAGLGLFPRIAWRWLPLALLALAALTMAADCAIAQWFAARPYPRLLAELIEVCESFGNGLGVFVLALVIYQLDAERRWVLPRVLTASLGAGMAANGLKMLLARTRPRAFDFDGGVLATFGDWLPLGRGGAVVQSFPSAHTATAVGLAVALAWLYPRGRWTFGALAVLVACQRMQSASHYLSDVLVGAAVGLIVARGCVESGWLAARFDRLEARLKRRHAPRRNEQPTERPSSEQLTSV